ncbi:MAG: Rpn family recombination-promoting nuclease/putative transposase [Prevotellaceae bacterium]|jgi:predicted transposase/invertase (TIGR01784 family)|nr:Rpn family recombination-promoting nuclease/putative transposase [Prevotellaceae bacterium]
MAHYLDPKSDLVFKRIFGEHKNLCISLLNSMLPLKETQQIVSIEYNPSEFVPEIDALKNSIVDVRCTDNYKRQFIVEMQMYWTKSFKQRVLLNASKAYVNQLEVKQPFKLLHPVYALTFVNQNFNDSPDYYHDYKIVNIANTEERIDGLEFIFIELPKFKPQNRAEKKLHELWLRFMTEIEEKTEQVPPELLENTEISEAIHYAEKSAYTKVELNDYDKWLINALTAQSALLDMEERGMERGMEKGMEKGIEKGMKKGIKKGMEEGMKKGIKKGMEKGKAEQNIEIAKKMLKKELFSFEDIAEITGLSIEEIETLK